METRIQFHDYCLSSELFFFPDIADHLFLTNFDNIVSTRLLFLSIFLFYLHLKNEPMKDHVIFCLWPHSMATNSLQVIFYDHIYSRHKFAKVKLITQ